MMIVCVVGWRRGGGDVLHLRRQMRRDDAHIVAGLRQRIGEIFENGAVVRRDMGVVTAGQRSFMLAVSVNAHGRMLLMTGQMR